MSSRYIPLHKKKTVSYLVPILLISIGMLVIAGSTIMNFYMKSKQDKIINTYFSQTNNGLRTDGNQVVIPSGSDKADLSVSLESISDINTIDGASVQKQSIIEPICLLSIPKIGLTMAVAEGVDNDILRYALGHYEGTALPGENGNFSVIGHRNYAFGQFLNRLDEVEEGDNIIVKRENKEYEYIVTQILVVNPEDTWVLDPTPDARITLVTCTPVRIATHRLIVKGVLKT